MKKVVINIALVLLIFVCYFLQSNFFSWFTIAGVSPNLFVIFIVFVGLFGNKFMGVTYGLFLGFFLDYLFRSKVGISAIGLALIGILAKVFDKNFSKDSRMTIMLMVAGITASYEIIIYFLNYFILNGNLEILEFLKILLIEIIYNIIITIIIYPLIKKFGYYIENEYKGNKILTRYF